jgi:AcrR family transcriptional regulator
MEASVLMKASWTASTTGRRDRRRVRTREALVAAARTVMARKGVAPTTIADITEEADVGFGTFYNYFTSKEEIVRAVVAASGDALGDAIDRYGADLDVAEAVSVGIRTLLRRVEDDQAWAWFVARLGHSSHDMLSGLTKRLLRDVKRGHRAGRFTVAGGPTLGLVVAGAVLSVLRARLEGVVGPEADRELAAHVLALLGVPRDDAAKIARRPLPAITTP